MDRFFELLRTEIERELSVGGNYSSKPIMLAMFDRCFARAVAKYAREIGVNLT